MKTTLRFLTAATALMLSAQAFAQTPPPGVYMTMGSQLIGILTDGSYCMVVQNDVKNGGWQETPDGTTAKPSSPTTAAAATPSTANRRC